MIEAIFERRMSMLDQRRVELLDALESTGEFERSGGDYWLLPRPAG